MVPEVLRKPWSAGLIATLSASLVLLQTSDDPQWIAALWTGAVVFCVLVGGRPGAFLETHLAKRRLSPIGLLLEAAFLTAPIVMATTRFAPVTGFVFGLWFGRWLTRRDVEGDPFGQSIGWALLAGFGYAVVTGPDPAWDWVVLVTAGVWLLHAGLYTGIARYVRPLQDRVSMRVLVFMGVATLISGLVLPAPRNTPGVLLILTATGLWFARWFLADPAIDAERDTAPEDAAAAPA